MHGCLTEMPNSSETLYGKLQRKGFLRRDVQRLVNNDRNVFSSLLLHHDLADGMVTGVTRSYDKALRDVRLVLSHDDYERTMGVSVVINKSRTLFIADTNITEFPTPGRSGGYCRDNRRVCPAVRV